MSDLFGIDPSEVPQDPFLPQWEIDGPTFLDDAACLCALRTIQTSKSTVAAWQCIGNQTQDVYEVTTGKWFNSVHGGTTVDLPVDDASNPPDTASPQTFNPKPKTFTAVTNVNQTSLSIYDKYCTAKNQTTFSTAFYRSAAEENNGATLVDAAPCFRPGAFPMLIQKAQDWVSQGCMEGFLCANNTVNSLPQFCPPITECQEARLAGDVCQFQGANIGMGPFEPVVCQEGYYCPIGGTQKIPCPAGSYCQPGCSTPTPCGIGSSCPEGSVHSTFIVPIVILILIDVLLIVGIVWHSLWKRKKAKSATSGFARFGKGLGRRGVKATITGYKQLDDENDHEMAPMNETYATYVPGQDVWTGFQAALDVASVQGTRLEDLDAGLTPQLKAFVESMRRAADATHFGLSFSYSDLSYQPKGSPKPILQNVTGSIARGSLVAVMGGSGAGKSTFVNVLMGKTTNTGGTVMVNDVPGKIKRYKKLIGYVPQDDIVLPELTVYENILHSAKIRLPRGWSDDAIEAHVTSVIDCLELSHVRNSLVGSVGKPVISGGQRKRVSIGMELAAAPMAIFLDEPTSGLDATAASSIMRTLQALSRLGISVIVIIHQPRMEIFEMLDSLILLGKGQIIYEGSEKDVRPFFEKVGFHFPPHANFGDVVTDIITGNGRPYKKSGEISIDALIAHWASSRKNTVKADRHQSSSSIVSAFTAPKLDKPTHQILKQRGARRWKQTQLCLQRAMVQQYRTKANFWFEMGLATIGGFLIGLAENSKHGILFTGLYNAPFDVLSVATDLKTVPETSLLIAIGIGLVAAAPGVRVFSEEMLLHRREAEAGHSRSAYFVAKVFSVFPRMILGCLHFSTPMLLLSTPIINWGLAYVANLMYFYCIYGLASFVSMVVRREDAPLLATMIALIVGILCGAAPPLSKAVEWHMDWLWRASPGTWLAELYFGQLVSPFAYIYNVELASLITGYRLDWLWRNILILFSIGTIYRILAFAGLFAGKRLRI